MTESPPRYLDLDELREVAADLIDRSPDSRSAAADRIGVNRSTVSRALADGATGYAEVLAQLIGAYSEATMDPTPRYQVRGLPEAD